ncbi:MAG TPA: SRPBCC domain-containing protein [Thermoanaerobaculia bacterium]|nr:SRPBCC domain-containing protein [Thermoanaerobaculia bacterium]
MTTRTSEIVWRLRLKAAPRSVFALLTTDEGRASFWAERTVQEGDAITFRFPSGEVLASRILELAPPHRFSLTYFDATTVTFELEPAGEGTDLRLHEANVPAATEAENRAGWVSVLLNLKARADHGIDLRNHDPECTWSKGYVDN